MWQKFYIALIIVAALSCFIYYKIKIERFKYQVELFLLFGLAITLLGCTLVYIISGTQALIDSLALRFENIVGRFILIGYSLFLAGVLFQIDRTIIALIGFFKKKGN